MGKLKHDRKEAQRPEYRPMQWTQASGFSVDDDARWTVNIIGRDPEDERAKRENEIRRLAHFHGREYARHVAARVIDIIRAKDSRKAA